MSTNYSLKNKILKENLLPYRCQRCGCDGHWEGGIISLQLHHKDGNHQNNNLDNLEFLCPNCHALTDSWCKNNRQNSFDENSFLAEIYHGKTIRQALLAIGLSDGSVNYKKAYQVLQQQNIDYHTYQSDLEINYCKKCGTPISKDATYCSDCWHQISRTCERPSPEQLLEEIATSSFVKVGAKYGVSDKGIVKWCKAYGLPTKKKDLVNLYKQKKSTDNSIE